MGSAASKPWSSASARSARRAARPWSPHGSANRRARKLAARSTRPRTQRSASSVVSRANASRNAHSSGRVVPAVSPVLLARPSRTRRSYPRGTRTSAWTKRTRPPEATSVPARSAAPRPPWLATTCIARGTLPRDCAARRATSTVASVEPPSTRMSSRRSGRSARSSSATIVAPTVSDSLRAGTTTLRTTTSVRSVASAAQAGRARPTGTTKRRTRPSTVSETRATAHCASIVACAAPTRLRTAVARTPATTWLENVPNDKTTPREEEDNWGCCFVVVARTSSRTSFASSSRRGVGSSASSSSPASALSVASVAAGGTQMRSWSSSIPANGARRGHLFEFVERRVRGLQTRRIVKEGRRRVLSTRAARGRRRPPTHAVLRRRGRATWRGRRAGAPAETRAAAPPRAASSTRSRRRATARQFRSTARRTTCATTPPSSPARWRTSRSSTWWCRRRARSSRASRGRRGRAL
mmetsp:Transcript_1695/g.6529  ORF Transcript_1695/g.6529 Transcript_1695/m.6529 type:complete len:469 (-) Transcript_1695:949-2355(-)